MQSIIDAGGLTESEIIASLREKAADPKQLAGLRVWAESWFTEGEIVIEDDAPVIRIASEAAGRIMFLPIESVRVTGRRITRADFMNTPQVRVKVAIAPAEGIVAGDLGKVWLR